MTRAEQTRIDSAIAALAEQVKKMPPGAAVALKAERRAEQERINNLIEALAEQQANALVEATKQRDLLRAALVKLVGVDGRAELEQMEAVIRGLPAPAEDKAATIDAIHALIATAAAP